MKFPVGDIVRLKRPLFYWERGDTGLVLEGWDGFFGATYKVEMGIGSIVITVSEGDLEGFDFG